MKTRSLLLILLPSLVYLSSCTKLKDPNLGTDCRIVKINVVDRGIFHYTYDNHLRMTSVAVEVSGQRQTMAEISYVPGKAFINFYQSTNGAATSEADLDQFGNVTHASVKDPSGSGIGSVDFEYNEWNAPKPVRAIVEGFINGTSNLLHDTIYFTWADSDLIHLTSSSQEIAYDYYSDKPAPITRYGNGNIILLIGDMSDAASALSQNYLKTYDIGGASQIEYSYDFDQEGKVRTIFWSTLTDQGTSTVSYQCDH